MSEVIRSSMTSIPEDRWDKAFGKKELVEIAENISAMAKQAEESTNEC